MSLRVELLIIDPNNDFCEKGITPPIISGNVPVPKSNNLLHMPYKGSLYVPGADQDMVRLSAMIDRLMWKISDIHVTLDSHHRFSIFHPCFLVDQSGQHPNPFTEVHHKDIVDGILRATCPGKDNWLQQWLFDYTKALEDNGRYPYYIWPYHCIIGSPGAAIYPELLDALLRWESKPGIVDMVTKGSNFKTEHYSAVRAEVPDPQDNGTLLNTKLIGTLERADLIGVGGQARNFCVASTVGDIVKEFGPDAAKKIVILTDAMSPVPGQPDTFIDDMKSAGVHQFSTTTEFLA